jgi:lipoprotein-anchoring transpeptidase ErfK/SrfK
VLDVQMWLAASERFVMFTDNGARVRWLQVPIVLAAAGAIGVYFAAPALAESARTDAQTSGNVAGTPCTATAAACVDVENKQAWLIKDGKVTRGPVAISTGGTGTDTPTGDSFRVFLKDKDHTSNEFKLPNGQPAPMPNAVFFEDGGIAFHAGSPQRASAGCVHLGLSDSLAFFNFLNVGDQVQVMNGPVAASDDISPAVADAGAPKDDSNDPDAHSSAPERSDDDGLSRPAGPGQ